MRRRPSCIAAGAALRCTRPLLAYNKSGGYRWSPIPKPPPPHFDRLYGTHSVLNTLRVAAQRQQQQQQQQQHAQKEPEAHASTSVTSSPAAVAAAITAPASAPQWHPHRAQLTCLYVRDFSIEAGQTASNDGKGGADSGDSRGDLAAASRGRNKKIIPARYTAVRCITALAKSLEVPVRFVPRAELVQLCGERRNQNVVLEASTYTPVKVRHLGEVWAQHPATPDANAEEVDRGAGAPVTVLFLEHIIDPTNIGGILRTAFFFGVDHVVLSRQCAACTAAVSRTSTGFLEHLHVYRATTSSADFLRASQCAFRGDGRQGCQLEVIASTVVASESPPPSTHDSGEGAGSGDDAVAATATDAAPRDTPDAAAPALTSTPSDEAAAASTYPPAVRVVLLGNEDAGLPSELLQWCTHVVHVRSPRQLRLRRARSTTAAGGGDEGDAPTEEARRTADTPSAGATRTELDKWQRNLRRLAQLREKEVSLNVNTATAALLSSLCRIPEALPTNAEAHSHPRGSTTVAYGLVEVRALRNAAP